MPIGRDVQDRRAQGDRRATENGEVRSGRLKPPRTSLLFDNLQGWRPPGPRMPPSRPRRAACRGGGGSVPAVCEGRGASHALGAEVPSGWSTSPSPRFWCLVRTSERCSRSRPDYENMRGFIEAPHRRKMLAIGLLFRSRR